MTQYLPPNLLALFAPRPPLPYLPPTKKLAHEKRGKGYALLSDYKQYFEDPKDKPDRPQVETKLQKLERKKREKEELAAYKVEQAIALWDPKNNEEATSDPYKTLFVARLDYDVSEAKLRREFETYGPIKKICMIKDRVTGKPRGYAFIEFKEEYDKKAAYRKADGIKIGSRRVLVDKERGRSDGWLPRRLGGGLGGSKRKAKKIE